jgi:hypothetical protein
VLVAGDPVIVDRIPTKVEINQIIAQARNHIGKR